MADYAKILADNPNTSDMAEYVAGVKLEPTPRMKQLWSGFTPKQRDIVVLSFLQGEGY
jgi:hypothetical protein